MSTTDLLRRLELGGDLAEAAVKAVRAAGQFIRTERQGFTRADAETKGANDLVSYVDRGAEAILKQHFADLTPGCGFIAEESGETHADKDFVWIIDPLDGTTNFVFGVPVFSVSAGLQYKGKLILGLVYEVNQDELFTAGVGQGAYLNGTRIRCNPTKTLAETLIATGFPFRRFGHVEQYLYMLRDFMQETRGLRRMGSAAVDLAYTACGRFDGFFETNLYPWDVAAGGLIVREAGGIVTDFEGGDAWLMGRSLVAAGPGIYEPMFGLIQRYHTPE